MKTKHLLLASGILLGSYGNYSFSQTTIYPLIEAGKSRGFTTWAPVSGATGYVVEIYGQSGGSSSLISSITTTQNYVHMDPLMFTIPDVSYKVVALKNGAPMAESDQIPNSIIPGAAEYETVCTKTCNGKTVAWKMDNFAEKHYTGQLDNNGNPMYYLGNKRLMLTTAYQYYDAANATYVPFWQAVSAGAFASMSSATPIHPYAQSTLGGVPLYQRKLVSANLASGPFRDANNNVVIDGWLVEKKLDEYSYLTGVSTYTTADAGTNICSTPINGYISPWVNFFNSYMDDSGITPPSAVSPHFNNGITPSGIGCSPAWTNPPVGGGPGGPNWNQWLTNLHKAVAKLEKSMSGGGIGTGGSGTPLTWTDVTRYVNELSTEVSADGDYVTSVAINSIIDDRVRIGYTNRNGAFTLVSSAGDVTVGLYAITLFTSDGNAIPTVLEFTKDLAAAKQREFVKVGIAPNPVANNVLVVQAETTRDVSAQLFVHNLSGEQVYAEPVSLKSGSAFETRIDITGVSTPMQQLRVSLIFGDGSVIQQTALVVQ